MCVPITPSFMNNQPYFIHGKYIVAIKAGSTARYVGKSQRFKDIQGKVGTLVEDTLTSAPRYKLKFEEREVPVSLLYENLVFLKKETQRIGEYKPR